jgi:hypothetical protein
MSSNLVYSRIIKLLTIILACVAGLAMSFSLVYALMVTINTNDGIVDPNWASGNHVVSDPQNDWVDTPGTPTEDIKNAWIANDANYLTFRIDTYGSPATGAGTQIVAILDCSVPPNGNYSDTVDRKIVYRPNQTTAPSPCLNEGDPPNPDGCAFIVNGQNSDLGALAVGRYERINNTMEWQVHKTNAPLGDCETLNPLPIAFSLTSTTASGGTYPQYDNTDWVNWSIPTSVDVIEFQAKNKFPLSNNWIIAIAMMGLVSGIGAFLLHKKGR